MGRSRNILGLDILKILATTLIVFHHYQQVFKVQFNGINFYDGAFNFAYLVELFFIISGFLSLYTAKAGEDSFLCLRHKWYRIWPMAAIACVFTLLVKSIGAEDLHTLWNMKTLIANIMLIFSGWPYFSMTGINNPTWYLCVLIQCYFLFYAFLWLCYRMKLNRVLVVALLLCVVFMLHRHGVLERNSFRGFESFFIGVALCDLRNQIPQKKCAALFLFLVSLVLLVFLSSMQRRILVLITFPSLVLLSTWYGGMKNEAVQRMISQMGKMSFDVYIWHYPLMAFERMLMRVFNFEFERTYLLMTGFTLIIWLLAWPLHRFVERPINKMIRKRIL